MLRRLFSRSTTTTLLSSEGFHTPRTGKELMEIPRRQQMLKLLWDTTSLTQGVFDEYLLAPISRYAELVQLLPASESHHHAYPGGMLDHALEMACYGLRLRQRHLLPPGAKPEDQSSAGELWSAAVIYGALMHDAAKALVDVEIHLEDGQEWRLWHGPIPGPYRVRYRAGREYHLHAAVNPLFCERVLGARVLDWLMTQPRLFSLTMYTIAGHTERGEIIAELIHQADRASVAKALGGDPVQALSAPVESIQRKLAEGLRYMVKEQFKLNQKGGVAWLTEEALWLVSPKAVNELKAHLYAQGIKSIPADLNRLYGELQAHGLIKEVSEGKSVWKCEIVDGDWAQTFNMIKVAPTLIWGLESKPEPFGGKVVIQGAGMADQKTVAEVAETPASKEKEGEPGGALSSSEAAPLDAVDDDIMAMFPEIDAGNTKETAKSDNENAGDAESPSALIPAADVDHQQGGDLVVPDAPGENHGDLGHRFWHWLKAGLADHSIIINDTKAPVHVIDRTYFLVSPGIFKRFSASVLLEDDEQWKEVQKSFQKLSVHVRNQGKNIHTCLVEGPKKRTVLKGYLIKDPSLLISGTVPADNWVLTLESEEEKGGQDECE